VCSRGFWSHYPQRNWTEADWKAWEKAGRPSVPRDLALGSEFDGPYKPVGDRPPVAPPGLAPVMSWRLFETPAVGGARSKAVDRLLDDLGVRPRRGR
jgi:hypothetical protein